MKIRIHFASQLKKLAEVEYADVEMETRSTTDSLIKNLTQTCNLAIRTALLETEGNVRSSVLVFVDNVLVDRDCALSLTDRSEVLVTTLISGG
jgi:hypothetical protein